MFDCDQCSIGKVIIDKVHRYHAPICQNCDKTNKDIPQPRSFYSKN